MEIQIKKKNSCKQCDLFIPHTNGEPKSMLLGFLYNKRRTVYKKKNNDFVNFS